MIEALVIGRVGVDFTPATPGTTVLVSSLASGSAAGYALGARGLAAAAREEATGASSGGDRLDVLSPWIARLGVEGRLVFRALAHLVVSVLPLR